MAHSTYSMSSAYRWIEGHCPASIRMSKPYPSSTNEAAEQGTAAHELREFCLKIGVSPRDCIGMTFNGFEVDTEMAEGVSIDVNYVNRLTLEYGVKPLLEQRVTMSSLGRTDVFGTADTTFIVPHKRLVHTIDFKFGFGVVEPEENWQLRGYCVSTLDTFDLWGKVDKVITTITQPRYQHNKGLVRSTSYTTEQMNEFGDTFYRSILAADDPRTKPNPGKWCKYCPARGNCRARMLKTIEMAYRGEPIDELTSDEIEILLAEIPVMTAHLEAIEKEAVRRAQRGHRFGDWKLVDSRPRAKCSDEKQLIAEAVAAGVNADRLFDKRLKAETSIRKVLPGELVDKFYVKPPATDILVPMSDKRVAKIVGQVRKGTFGIVSK